MRETWVQPLGQEDFLEKENATLPLFWPGKFHGLYSPRGRKESDTAERLPTFAWGMLEGLPASFFVQSFTNGLK